MFSGHPNIRNALYLQPPHTHAAVFLCGFCVGGPVKFNLLAVYRGILVELSKNATCR